MHARTYQSHSTLSKGARAGSSSRFIQLYKQDSDKVPPYYCRPGPGDYEIDPKLGKMTLSTHYTNSPAYTIPR